MIKYFNDGGIFMWGIMAASICAIAVILEKMWLFLTREKDFTKDYRQQLYKALMEGSNKEIVEISTSRKNSVARTAIKTVQSIGVGLDEVKESQYTYLEEIIREAILEETGKLEKGMWLLGAVVNTAPQLGLLGTVTGMITSFSALTINGAEKASVVAAGIAEALYTTAFGLIVAIPALLFYNYFNRRIDTVVLEMERAGLHFLSRIKKRSWENETCK